MTEQLINNWLCWAIILLALVCYYQLWLEYLNTNHQLLNTEGGDFTSIGEATTPEFSTAMIAALPLMGLLGTIIGLLDCFAGIANQGASSELVSSGIADALLTTQLGLVCAIPAWLLQAWVRRARRQMGSVISVSAAQTE